MSRDDRATPDRDTRGREAEEVARRVCVLDYGMGNLRSVEKAFERVGAAPVVTSDVEVARGADGLVLPGVGAFPRAMARIRELGIDALLRDHVAADRPVLGICLGAQLVLSSSTELAGDEGLGLLEGEVTPLKAPGLKLPHIGWEPVRWERDSELSEGISDGTPFYFVHTYAPRPAQAEDVLGTAVHGERFVCALARPPVYGAQFHPEKSSAAGLKVLENFTRLCDRASDHQPAGSGHRAEPSGGAV